MEREVRERMRGGKGGVEILHIFRKEELKGRTRLFARLRLPPGSSIGYHTHDGEEEIFYILSGDRRSAATAACVDQSARGMPCSPGEAAGHSIANIGSGPLELMAVILLY